MSRQSIRPSIGGGEAAVVKINPEGFKQKISQLTNDALDNMFVIWAEAGYDEGECQTLLGDLLAKIKCKYSEELLAEKHILDHAKSQVQNKLKYYNDQCQKLGRSGMNESNIGINCTDRLVALDKLILEIDQEIGQREKVFKIEIERCASVSRQLGEPIKTLEDFKGPAGTTVFSDVRLNLMKEHMEKMEIVKNKRILDISAVAESCCQVMVDLEIFSEGWQAIDAPNRAPNPKALDNSLMQQCTESLNTYKRTGQKEQLGLHLDDFNRFQSCYITLVKEKEARRDELARLGSEIARLWTLLRVAGQERDQFQNSFKMNLSRETLVKGDMEYQRLLEIRKSSLQTIIGSIRSEIQSLWEESGIDSPDIQSSEFPVFFQDVDTLDDAMVEVHEAYLSKLKLRVGDLRPILSKIYKREQVVQERVELEQLQLNPERLTARGPSAREDRKREEGMINRVKMLEKLTKEIMSSVQVWEDTYGPLVFAGERYMDRVVHQEDKYIEIRDSLRSNRKRKESIQAGGEADRLAAAMNKSQGAKTAMAPPANPNSMASRKILTAPAGSRHAAASNFVDLGSLGQMPDENSFRNGHSERTRFERTSTGTVSSDETCATEVIDKSRESCATVIKATSIFANNSL